MDEWFQTLQGGFFHHEYETRKENDLGAGRYACIQHSMQPRK